MSSSPASLSDPKQVLDRAEKPAGVISKRAQQYVFVGIAVVIVVISMFSSNRQPKAPAKNDAAKTPVLEETNQRKLTDYAAELTAEQKAAERARLAESATLNRRGEALSNDDPRFAAASSRSEGGSQFSPEPNNYSAPSTQPDPLEQRERERAYNARFASNFAFTSPVMKSTPAVAKGALDPPAPQADPQPQLSGQESGPSKKSSVNVNDATGPPYVLFEGTLIETALVNRLDGDFSGPVKVMVTNSVFSHDRQHVLIPEGTFLLGEVKPVQGFGQRRLAVVFHRLLMPDGSFVEIDPRKKRVGPPKWHNDHERPVFFVELREKYVCTWLERHGNSLILVPSPESGGHAQPVRYPGEATIVGQVTVITMRIAGGRED